MQVQKSAAFSECGLYRYELTRLWDVEKPQAAFIGLNPSKANATKDDPTVNKLFQSCIRWGYGGFVLMNLFARRAVTPRELMLLKPMEIIGKDNFNWLKKLKGHEMVVFMWGHEIDAILYTGFWVDEVKAMFPNAYCFKHNKNGSPAHPLYLPNNLRPIKFRD